MKRLVDIDNDLLERARKAMGTSTMKETVNAALALAADARAERMRIAGDALAALAEAGAFNDAGNGWR